LLLEAVVDVTKIGSVAVGIAFMAGVLYNFGYFWGLGLNFFTFLNYKDHLAVLIFFAGPWLLLSLICVGWRSGPKKKTLDWVARGWTFLVLFAWLERGEIAVFPHFASTVFWFRGFSSFLLVAYLTAVVFDFLSTFELGKTSAQAIASVFFIVVIMMGLMVMFGNYMYWRDVESSRFDTEVTLASEDKTPSPPRSARLLRAVDEGLFLVLKDSPDRVVFIRKDDVKAISMDVRK
jgi:hypothetical protein